MSATPLLEHRTQVTAYGNDLFRVCGVEFTKTTEMQRQVSGAFLFGVAYAHGRVHRLAPPDVHALVISMLMDILRYSAEQAGAFSSRLVQAASAGPNDTMKAIIHRGIDGHQQLTSGEHDALRQNLPGFFQPLRRNDAVEDATACETAQVGQASSLSRSIPMLLTLQ